MDINWLEQIPTERKLLSNLHVAALREAAWNDLFRRYQIPAVNYVRGIIRGISDSDAQDIVQAAMTKLFKSGFRYDPSKGKFRSFLMKVLHNVAMDFLRAQKSKAASFALVEQLQDERSPEDPEWERECQAQLLLLAFAEVEKHYSEFGLTHTFDAWQRVDRLGVPAAEVARQLKISVDTVHQACSRVRKELRAMLVRLDGA